MALKRSILVSLLLLFTAYSYAVDRIDLIAGNHTYGYGGDGASPLSAAFTWSTGMAQDAAGNLAIADIYSGSGGGRVRVVNMQSTTQTLWGVSVCPGCIQTIAGTGKVGYTGDNGPATSATLNHPCYVAIDSAGNLYIADQANNVIRKVDVSGTITTFAGGGHKGHCSPCLATNATYVLPQTVEIGPDGNLYLADTNYNLIEVVNMHATKQTIFGVSVPPNNSATVVGGFGVSGDGIRGDGGAATSASLSTPLGLAFDASGNLYIADTMNNVIRKVAHATNTISTVVGNVARASVSSVSYGAGVTTYTYTLTSGSALTVGTYMDIKGCTSAGNNTSVAGPNYASLRITALSSRTFSVANTHGVTESDSHCTAVGGTQGYSGDGSNAKSAQMYWPYDVKIDGAGDMYISDTLNNVIRKVDHVSGNISNFAGVQYTYAGEQGTPSIAGGQYGGDGGIATAAHLNFVVCILPAPSNTIYLADGGNAVVRELSPFIGGAHKRGRRLSD